MFILYIIVKHNVDNTLVFWLTYIWLIEKMVSQNLVNHVDGLVFGLYKYQIKNQ